MYRSLYQDDLLKVVAIIDSCDRVTGLVATFYNVLARKVHYKPNASMFVYKGRWFKGTVDIDDGSVLYMNIERFGYIVVDGLEAIFREVGSVDRL
jgi:hypothetical protein